MPPEGEGTPAPPAADASSEELRRELGELRSAVAELRAARTPEQRREARAEVADAQDDVEKALRKAGYKLTRADLDDLVEQKEEERFRARMKRFLGEQAAAEAEADGKGKKPPAGEGKGEGEGKQQPPAKRDGWLRSA